MENDEEYEHLASEFYYLEERLDEDTDEISVEASRHSLCFFYPCLFFKRDSFPDNCVDWTNANVWFGP